ncbi:glycoprotein gp100-like [Penaeus chinensis]|uniref:glycoprotein gp100-like n=1 Tax=Penaeus chinensis TaxID=139456 RepID=UPI001FB57819|nr:glycoprotein gp100-like [Penaeus chinensis]
MTPTNCNRPAPQVSNIWSTHSPPAFLPVPLPGCPRFPPTLVVTPTPTRRMSPISTSGPASQPHPPPLATPLTPPRSTRSPPPTAAFLHGLLLAQPDSHNKTNITKHHQLHIKHEAKLNRKSKNKNYNTLIYTPHFLNTQHKYHYPPTLQPLTKPHNHTSKSLHTTPLTYNHNTVNHHTDYHITFNTTVNNLHHTQHETNTHLYKVRQPETCSGRRDFGYNVFFIDQKRMGVLQSEVRISEPSDGHEANLSAYSKTLFKKYLRLCSQ